LDIPVRLSVVDRAAKRVGTTAGAGDETIKERTVQEKSEMAGKTWVLTLT